jgi:glycosyltransferase involved in cell wall biosynthesis
MPAALPRHVVPAEPIVRPVSRPLELLLLVGREYERKGVDIAIEVVRQLNRTGVAARLTVCGIEGPSGGEVSFVGPFRKSVRDELDRYVGLYRRADLLIHPARFDPSPIVPAEAAAFGVPTITNATGGVATSVKDRVSGVVLPKGSPAGAYVDAITGLVGDSARYEALRRGARARYETEQNWATTGRRIVQLLEASARDRTGASEVAEPGVPPDPGVAGRRSRA